MAERRTPTSDGGAATQAGELIIAVEPDYVVANKPVGFPVHATHDPERLHLEQLVAEQLHEPATVVHRLDVWTSGVVVLARTVEARRRFNALFEAREVTKNYEAVCLGVPDPSSGSLKHYLAKQRISGRDIMQSVHSGGKVALTEYHTKGTGSVGDMDLSLVELIPTTGRTHQLRVQTAEAGWPILGDRQYVGSEPANSIVDLPGQLLHARLLTFVDPFTGDSRRFQAPTPSVFERFAAPLRKNA